jgi:transposase
MVFGGVEYGSGQITFREEERKNSAGFIEWLKEIEQAYPEELVLVVLDNVGYHKSRRCLDWWQAHQDHIRPFFLPAYAPHLNLMERLWRYLKGKLSCHRWWAEQSVLKKATEEILSHMEVRFGQESGPTITLVQNICYSA